MSTNGNSVCTHFFLKTICNVNSMYSKYYLYCKAEEKFI